MQNSASLCQRCTKKRQRNRRERKKRAAALGRASGSDAASSEASKDPPVEATGAPTGGAQLEPLPELMRRTSGSNAEGSMAVGVERPPHRHGHPTPAAATPHEDQQHVSSLTDCPAGPRQPTCSRHTHQRPQGRETQRAECGGQPLKGTGELRAVTVAGGSACSRTARADAPTSAQACGPRVGGGSQRRAQRVLTGGCNAARGPTARLPAGG